MSLPNKSNASRTPPHAGGPGEPGPGNLQDPAVTPTAEATAGPRPTGKRLLLVDDDAGVRGSLGQLLVEEGYVVLPAHDGKHALSLIARQPVDLVLLDLNMPVKNGWDTFERLSYRYPLVPVVLITARSNQLFPAAGAGVGALLEKPLDIPTLLRTITKLLAEPDEVRLARLAGRKTEFYYAAGRTATTAPPEER